MKTCPKCNDKYFDTDEYCSECCNVKLIDNKIYNEILAELSSMSYEEREKHKYESRYRTAYRYNYDFGYRHGNTTSQSTTGQQQKTYQKTN